MYKDLDGDKNLYKRYWLRTTSVSVKEFQTYVVHVIYDVKDADERCHHV